MVSLLGLLAVVGASLAMTGLVRREAIRLSVLDVANDRSMHERPTPRGGGLSIVLFTALAALLGCGFGSVEGPLATVVVLGAALLGGVGWLDDRFGVSAILRFLIHGLCAAIAVRAVAPDLGALSSVIAVLAMIWSINLFNFMDGIDGYAGVEFVSVLAPTALLALWVGDTSIVWLGSAGAAASVGFLFWNWPPAKIFMGDVGSGFCGFLIACFALRGSTTSLPFLIAVAVLFVGFWFDATVTLLVRLATRQRWYSAHRQHAYQKAAIRVGHAPVTKALALVNFSLLTPVALLIGSGRAEWWLGVLAALPVVLIIMAFSPGTEETT